MDPLQVSRPRVLVEHETEPVYCYFKSGSAFLVRYGDELFALTADHCVEDYQAEQLRISTNDDSTNFLAFNTKWRPTSAGAADYLDFWILRIDEKSTPAYATLVGILLDEAAVFRARAAYYKDAQLIVSGYPGAAINEIDFDSKTVRKQRVISRARYVGAGPTPHSHLLRDIDRLVTEYSGYSGSPVLVKRGRETDLAGIVVRANDSSGIMLFIDIAAIWFAFRKTIESP